MINKTERQTVELYEDGTLQGYYYTPTKLRIERKSIYEFMGVNPNLKLYATLITDFYVSIVRGMGKYGVDLAKIKECFYDALDLVADENTATQIPRRDYATHYDYEQVKWYRELLKKCRRN